MLNHLPGARMAFTDAERKLIYEQLERLLSNPYFNHSRRFPSFLRFVTEQTLSGRTELLKERTLGIEIFGREADYDTASDPIVRVTATEIRKRIAQYYQEPGHEAELRFSLPAGSYVPQFLWTSPIAKPDHEKEEAVFVPARPVPTEVSVVLTPDPPRRWLKLASALSLATLLILGAGAATFWRASHRSPLDFFWGPLANSSEPVLFCISDQRQYPTIALRDAVDPTHETLLKENLTAIVIDDLNSVVRVAGLLQSRGVRFNLKSEGATDLNDLRSGPTVFIGAFDNAWTLRLTGPLRFHFANNPQMTEFRIVDRKEPLEPGWELNRQQQLATNDYRDFAIVARFTDSTTGKVAVVAAGVGRGGTQIAGEYVTDPGDLEQLEQAAAQAGNKKNMEVVLSTHIIDGEPGSPKVEASYFW